MQNREFVFYFNIQPYSVWYYRNLELIRNEGSNGLNLAVQEPRISNHPVSDELPYQRQKFSASPKDSYYNGFNVLQFLVFEKEKTESQFITRNSPSASKIGLYHIVAQYQPRQPT